MDKTDVGWHLQLARCVPAVGRRPHGRHVLPSGWMPRYRATEAAGEFLGSAGCSGTPTEKLHGRASLASAPGSSPPSAAGGS